MSSIQPNNVNSTASTAIEVHKDAPDVTSTIYNNDNISSSKIPARRDGLGNLLFHMHSVHLKPILFAKEETSLQFYEHVGEHIYTLFSSAVFILLSDFRAR